MLVGREAERRRLDALLAAARLGESGVLVVSGEAGIGKTALLDDTRARARASDMRVLSVTGTETEHDLPFAGLAQLLRITVPDLDRLPAPQAEALGIALALRPGDAADRFAVGAGLLTLLTQRSEDAKDLGQPLPTGVVEAVRCAAASAQPTSGGVRAWSCRVAWRGVGGTRVTTTYDVSLRRGGCFSAGAAPRRPVRYDATIATYAEDPLNALVSVRRGC